MSKQSHLNQHSLILFDPYISPYQVLLLQVRVNLGMISMKEYSAFSKAPALLETQHQNV